MRRTAYQHSDARRCVLDGKTCDDGHPCIEGFTCQGGTCLAPNGEPPPTTDAGSNIPDAGKVEVDEPPVASNVVLTTWVDVPFDIVLPAVDPEGGALSW